MKLNFNIIFCLLTFSVWMTSCFSPSDIVIADFDGDNYGAWKIEGNAFGTAPAPGNLPGQQNVQGYTGKGLANSFHEGENSIGTLTSPEFTIERDYINFLIGGGKNIDMYMELLVEGKSVVKSTSPIETETLAPFTWNVKEHIGRKAVIRIVDNRRGGWEYILIDRIVQSNKPETDILVDYKLTFQADQKYILIQIEENASETRVTVLIEGVQEAPHSDIRIAQTKIDYWVPLKIEKYKGKEVTLVLDQTRESYTGLSRIKTSDTFDFNYNEKFRPEFHFSPQYGWTNDPNDMVYHNGTYHLFYQHNPYGSMWGNMSWGHATTTDLKNWKHEPVGIVPDSIGTIFSGSVVIDQKNTAGFGKGAMVAIYTAHGQAQTQCLAYSTDGGITFTKYENNPVLTDPAYIDFRDPKVFWHQASNQWIMSLATTQVITFYGSPDLKSWTRLSDFGTGIGNHNGVWECPDLFPLTYNGQTKWVLLVSINPGGPNGGSATQYFIGNFDGKEFKADPLPYPLWIDYGRDNYAGVTWDSAPDNRRIFIGWMSNWDYTNQVPTLNFRNGMTVPRELTLASNGNHIVLASNPVKEIDDFRSTSHEFGSFEVTRTYRIKNILENNRAAYEIEMTLRPTAHTGSFSFTLENQKSEQVVFLFDLAGGTLTVDRDQSGLKAFNEKFATGSIEAPLTKKEAYIIRLLVDRSSTELFVNNGEVVQTNCVFPDIPYHSLVFDVQDGTLNVENMIVHEIK
ncbi:MAG: GH32 C-terminal domain-containing protein [Bacteroides sp.]|nr:GH32 C-terminal domain-containing protein [Bacteroides sp.]